jgi:hypothetical protein
VFQADSDEQSNMIVCQRIDHALAFSTSRDQAAIPQESELVRYGRLRHMTRFLQLRHAFVAFHERRQNLKTREV